jgi:hypothetical protein
MFPCFLILTSTDAPQSDKSHIHKLASSLKRRPTDSAHVGRSGVLLLVYMRPRATHFTGFRCHFDVWPRATHFTGYCCWFMWEPRATNFTGYCCWDSVGPRGTHLTNTGYCCWFMCLVRFTGYCCWFMWGLEQHTLLGIVGLCSSSGNPLHWVLLLVHVGPRATHFTEYCWFM